MPLHFNIRHLERSNVRLRGKLPVSELDVAGIDPLIQASLPLCYDLEVQKVDHSFLIRGELRLTLDCQCVRCLKAFRHELVLQEWTCLLGAEAEEPLEVVNDLVDLTPHVRDDILLEFPQHPLCKPECGGLAKTSAAKSNKAGSVPRTEAVSSVWKELNKLKL